MQPWSVDVFLLPVDSTNSYVEGRFTESRSLAFLKGVSMPHGALEGAGEQNEGIQMISPIAASHFEQI